jgi:hypothetical protein
VPAAGLAVAPLRGMEIYGSGMPWTSAQAHSERVRRSGCSLEDGTLGCPSHSSHFADYSSCILAVRYHAAIFERNPLTCVIVKSSRSLGRLYSWPAARDPHTATVSRDANDAPDGSAHKILTCHLGTPVSSMVLYVTSNT